MHLLGPAQRGPGGRLGASRHRARAGRERRAPLRRPPPRGPALRRPRPRRRPPPVARPRRAHRARAIEQRAAGAGSRRAARSRGGAAGDADARRPLAQPPRGGHSKTLATSWVAPEAANPEAPQRVVTSTPLSGNRLGQAFWLEGVGTRTWKNKDELALRTKSCRSFRLFPIHTST